MSLKWRRMRRVLRVRLFVSLVVAVVFLWATLPYDSAIRLSVRFNAISLVTHFTWARTNARWLLMRAEFPVDWQRDVAIVLKTGYGTQERAAAWLDALPVGISPDSVIVVSDFEASEILGKEVPVHDVISLLETQLTVSLSSQYPRLNQWARLRSAVLSTHDAVARNLSKKFGWELDALKFIPGLQLAYSKMPTKKWFILVDDDTYLIYPSLDLILGHFDPSIPHYLGNAVGNYRHRFGHGGSSVILSQATMHQLFSSPEGRKAVATAQVRSLVETWGDRLLADTLMQVGIYIDERTSRVFNGEQPLASRLQEDRFCAPVTTFHRLSTTEMNEVGATFRSTTEPVLWIHLWHIYKAPSLESFFGMYPWRKNWDHVGRLDELTTTISDVATSQECLHLCSGKYSKSCLAWAWDEDDNVCNMSPWMTVGKQAQGKISGPNVNRANSIADVCSYSSARREVTFQSPDALHRISDGYY